MAKKSKADQEYLREQAKELYLKGISTKAIAGQVGCSQRCIYKWAEELQWDVLRDEILQYNHDQIVFQNRSEALQIARNTFQAILRMTNSLASRETLTIKESADLVTVLKEIDKLIRLDSGQATEIVETPHQRVVKDFDVAEVKEAFKKDRFLLEDKKK